MGHGSICLIRRLISSSSSKSDIVTTVLSASATWWRHRSNSQRYLDDECVYFSLNQLAEFPWWGANANTRPLTVTNAKQPTRCFNCFATVYRKETRRGGRHLGMCHYFIICSFIVDIAAAPWANFRICWPYTPLRLFVINRPVKDDPDMDHNVTQYGPHR